MTFLFLAAMVLAHSVSLKREWFIYRYL
jgi:hypothetical protein